MPCSISRVVSEILPSCMAINIKHFLKYHFLLPLIMLAVFLLSLELTQLDLWLANHFYDAELEQWPYRDHWLAQTVLHKGGRYFVYAVGVGLLVACLASYRAKSAYYAIRLNLTFLVTASLLGPLIVTYLKSHTHIYCPWDLVLFGGSKPHVKLFDTAAGNLSIGHCFPSGHSALGFAFVSLYFFCWQVKPDYKYHALVGGLALGLVFAVVQEIRGAHFVSHDVVSLAICWFAALLLFVVFFRKQFKWS